MIDIIYVKWEVKKSDNNIIEKSFSLPDDFFEIENINQKIKIVNDKEEDKIISE